jgi:hypothetical protein
MRRDGCAANIAVMRRLFEAVETRGDPEDFAARWAAYVEMYDPDVVIHEAPSLPYGGDYSGDDAVARHAQAFKAAWQGLQSINDRAATSSPSWRSLHSSREGRVRSCKRG